jgi:hypothetical protein
MSYHDFTIENQGFPATRADINNALQALASTSSASTTPTVNFANQLYYDTTNNLLKMRSTSSPSQWITLAYFDQSNYKWEIRSSVVQAVDSGGIELKTDEGTTRVTVSDSGAVDVVGTLTAARGVGDTLTDASNTGSVTLDFSATQNFVLTLTGNVTLANPTTETVGQSGFIVFIQDGTGGRTVSLGTDYETANGAGLTLSSAASTTDIVPYIVAASGRILLGTPQLAFS